MKISLIEIKINSYIYKRERDKPKKKINIK